MQWACVCVHVCIICVCQAAPVCPCTCLWVGRSSVPGYERKTGFLRSGCRSPAFLSVSLAGNGAGPGAEAGRVAGRGFACSSRIRCLPPPALIVPSTQTHPGLGCWRGPHPGSVTVAHRPGEGPGSLGTGGECGCDQWSWSHPPERERAPIGSCVVSGCLLIGH